MAADAEIAVPDPRAPPDHLYALTADGYGEGLHHCSASAAAAAAAADDDDDADADAADRGQCLSYYRPAVGAADDAGAL